MSQWLTSGRNRLLDKQNKKFSTRMITSNNADQFTTKKNDVRRKQSQVHGRRRMVQVALTAASRNEVENISKTPSHSPDNMNEFRDLELMTASDENLHRIMAQRYQNEDMLLLKRKHDELHENSQLGTDAFDTQGALHGLAQRHHVPVMDLHDSRVDVVRHIDSERRKILELQHEFQLQEQLQIREELLKRKIQEEFDLIEQQRALQKAASDRLLISQFHGMENLVARQELLKYQSEVANSLPRADPSSMVTALGLLGQHGLDSEHFALRKNSPPPILSDPYNMPGNYGGVSNNDALNDLARFSNLRQSNALGDYAAHSPCPERTFEASLAELLMKNKMASVFPRVAHQNRPVDAMSLMEQQGRGLTKPLPPPPLFQNSANTSKNNQIQSNSHHRNLTVAELEQQIQQAILPNNYDHARKRIKLANNFPIENTHAMPKRVLSVDPPRSAGGGGGERLSSNIRYFNNGDEVNYGGVPIPASRFSEKYMRQDNHINRNSAHASLRSPSAESPNLASVAETTNQPMQRMILNETPSSSDTCLQRDSCFSTAKKIVTHGRTCVQ